MPNDSKRHVPDLSLAASPDHDGYLVCSEDGSGGGIQSSCTVGFRTGTGGNFTAVGGTSVAAPTFSAILALINQQLGSSGFGNVNPNLYQFAAGSSSPFHDVTTGNNMVPCTSGTPNCPAGTTQIGFSAGPGYDQVTGLGSVDADKLATAWAATVTPSFTSTASPVSYQIVQGSSTDATINVTFANGFSGTVSFTCTGASSTAQLTCTIPNPQISASGQVTAHVTSTSGTPAGTYVLVLTGSSGSTTTSTRAAVTVTQPLTLTPTAASFQVTQGAAIDATVASTNTASTAAAKRGTLGHAHSRNLPSDFSTSQPAPSNA